MRLANFIIFELIVLFKNAKTIVVIISFDS